MPEFNYESLLETFGDTLEKLSEDTSKQSEEGNVYLTKSKTKVINFDNFSHSIAESINPNNRPASCDVLLKLNNYYYFIEFKNGRIDEDEQYAIREKILESILVFLEQINQTISYSRNNCYFILVYNRNTVVKRNGLERITNRIYNLIHLNKYEKMYLKRAFVYSIEDFNKFFIERYGL